ncbi:hypothetical protein MNV49_002257 [Pseudohyphozyma bogoriensis]|nr:hypothetical protein MNV49_002257 [Pseudohyphozyma bogoriensis]
MPEAGAHDLIVPSESEDDNGRRNGDRVKDERPAKRTAEDKSTIATACLYCRRSKMKCIRQSEEESCRRCVAAKIQCETRARQSGRRPAKDPSKAPPPYTPKKLDQSQAPEMPPSTLSAPPPNVVDPLAARNVFSPVQPLGDSLAVGATPELSFPLDGGYDVGSHASSFFGSLSAGSQSQLASIGAEPDFSTSSMASGSVHSPASTRHGPTLHGGQMPFSSTEEASSSDHRKFTTTPLEMLAAVGAKRRNLLNPLGLPHHTSHLHDSTDHEVLQQSYFSDNAPVPPPLQGESLEYDPIDLALVSTQEAEMLFALFFKHLQPMVHLLDLRVDSLPAVRRRSSILLTAMLSSAARFAEGHAATSLRLDRHFKKTLSDAIISGGSNLDLIQAILVACPWLDAGSHVTYDQTSTYLNIANHAFTKIRPPPNSPETCLSLRAYERTYLTLYNFDRGSALVSGRPWSFALPNTELVTGVRKWVSDPLSLPEDWTLAALVVIRRDLLDVLGLVTNNTGSTPGGSSPADRPKPRSSPTLIKAIIEEFMSSWHADWVEPSQQSTRAYLSLIGAHTTLSVYIAALHDHVGRPTEAAVLQACLFAGLQTCRVAIAGRDEFKYLVNNAALMVAYAAAFSLKLVVHWKEAGSPIETSIHHLINEASQLLIDVGSSPTHRAGRAALYGHRLKSRLRDQAATRLPTRAPTPVGSPRMDNSHDLSFDPPNPNLDLVHMSEQSLNELLLGASDNAWLPLNSSLDSSLFFDTQESMGGGVDPFFNLANDLAFL